MGFVRTLYPSGLSFSLTGNAREIDLRQEFDNLIYGGPTSIPHGHRVLLRSMRRDDDNGLVECDCKDSLTHEAATERSCPYCLGEGYLWDEDWAVTYSTYIGADGGLGGRVTGLKPGTIRVDTKVFYFRYDTEITYADKIVELQLDTDGDPQVPYKREAIYKPQTIIRYRSDRGRIEYIAVYCKENDAIREEP
jgi:hypothetical protein